MSGTYRFTRSNVDETGEQVYQFIVTYIRDKGYSPSVRDICRGVGVKSTSTIHNHLHRLQDEGRITYSTGKRRAIVVPELEQAQVRQMPLIGRVAAGVPILAHENIERQIPVPADFFSDSKDMFALEVRGDSMIDAAILNGDIVFVQKQNHARTGEIVVALLDEEATVKRLVKHQERIYLKPENEAYPLIPFDHEGCSILGVVCGVFRVTL